METPLTNHLTEADFRHVYEPAEDTFLLLDALESELHILDEYRPQTCLEIGSGSGVIITALAKRLRSTYCIATDINMQACVATKRTALANSAAAALGDVINCNLADAFRSKSFDLIVFNPPYVVTPDDELTNSNEIALTYSWAGGKNGRQIIDKLLSKLDDMLSNDGVLYLLLLHENNPKQIEHELVKLGFESEIIMQRHIPSERLYILKVKRQ